MLILVLGLIVFLGVHLSGMFASQMRAKIIAERGRIFWMIPYTLVSLFGFYLIIKGYGAAWQDPVILYEVPSWTKHIAMVLVLLAFVAFPQSYVSGNIGKALKHPQLVAVKLWAVAHLITNGDLASVVLFGSFLLWAVVLRISLKRRVAAGLAKDNSGGPALNDVISTVVGVALYALFVVFAHEYLFGVSPIG